MIALTNKLFQPLTLQASSGTGIHLPPRGRVTVTDAEVSEEMRRMARRGFISLQPVATETSASPADTATPNKAGKRKEN